MVTTVRSLGLQGISGYEVTVECFLSGGLPAFDVVGLGDTAVKEARERVRAAIKNCGAKFPVSRITVNLAPANLKKDARSTTFRCCSASSRARVRSTRRTRPPRSSVSCRSPARCAPSAVCCRWRWPRRVRA